MSFDFLNNSFAGRSSHILLYHSTFNMVPQDLFGEVHNVTPDEFYKQITWVKDNFDIVSIDDLLISRDMKGKAAITFDDAYKSVFEEALPILKSLNVPCTIFINGCTLDKKVFWRDKVRYILNTSLVTEFVEANVEFCNRFGLHEGNFYRRTKHCELNSRDVEGLLDEFLDAKGIRPDLIPHCIDDPCALIRDNLVSYGSHSYSHYVMSSLTSEQQRDEIVRNINFFNTYNLKQSKIFSIPFGDTSSFDKTTIALLSEFNYRGFLYSRNRLNSASKQQFTSDGSSQLYYFDRYMPRDKFSSFQSQVAILNLRKTLGFHKVRQ